jgi:hypothetical protein
VGIYEGAFINPPVTDNLIVRFPTIFTNDGYNMPAWSYHSPMQPNNITKIIPLNAKKALCYIGAFNYTGTAATARLYGSLFIHPANTVYSYWAKKYKVRCVGYIHNKILEKHTEVLEEDTDYTLQPAGQTNIFQYTTFSLGYINNTSYGSYLIYVQIEKSVYFGSQFNVTFVPEFVCAANGVVVSYMNLAKEPIVLETSTEYLSVIAETF